MKTRYQLLQLLSDGRFHSGESLGRELGVSRAGIWKHVKVLDDWGLEVHAVFGKGYRLARPLELLDRRRILDALGDHESLGLAGLEIFPELDSTSAYLLKQLQEGRPLSGHACLAERQTAGRGRRGRQWVSPFASGVYLSVAWRFESGPAHLSGLSLAVAVAVIHALEVSGVRGLGVKWPNDILWQGRKIGGILVDVQGEADGPCQAVVGLGINGRLPARAAAAIEQPWVDLHTVLGGGHISRNNVACSLLRRLLPVLAQWGQAGFSAYHDAWSDRNVLAGKFVTVHTPSGVEYGTVEGVDETGALMLRGGEGGIQRFTGGEVSLRPLPDDATPVT